ncbi:hypothetical protein KFE25_010126 [Diacronema lutheri]|uniref:Uncharacterized protein n=1 Tax=Diacronema lutheri TaxID=2081491 RepID=A0A8J5XI30_DIALT|nr:hypothetical protein KFE25_010126 [Diacronema lutheri]
MPLRSTKSAALLVLAATPTAALCCLRAGATRVTLLRARSVVRLATPSDEDLFASLRARLSNGDDPKALQPLGPDEVSAVSLGPADLIKYVMDALVQKRFEVLLGFAAAVEGGKTMDFVGQLQPGAFSSPEALISFMDKEARYRTMLRISEWKPMGQCVLSNLSRNGQQKLLVRPATGNWEELYLNIQLVPYLEASKRWIITSMHKAGTADS